MTTLNRLLIFLLILAFPCVVYSRYYDSRIGKWVSPDPILDEYLPNVQDRLDAKKAGKEFNPAEVLKGHGGVYNPVNLNLYHYAGNNPVRYVDPDGNALLDTGIQLKKGDTVPVGWVFRDNSLSTFNDVLYKPGPRWVMHRNRHVLSAYNGQKIIDLADKWKSATSKINSGDKTTSITLIASHTGKRDDEGNQIYNLSVKIQEGKISETTSLYFFTAKDKLTSEAIIKADVSSLMNNISGSARKPVEVKVEDKR
ncbi:MAG TPA: hypothetical protein PKU84_05710 [Spirochaetota bacterium]|nr:hypothetical protein [Spirochaetota bacterium]